MRINVHFDGECDEFDVEPSPATVFLLKQMISQRSGIPVEDQNLFEYPEDLDNGPGLRMLADNHRFLYADTIKAHLTFVLTLGRASSWTYFYLHFTRNNQPEIRKLSSHRFDTIADIKRKISALHGLQVHSFQLSLDPIVNSVLADNLSTYNSGIQNGSTLYCVGNAPQLSQ